MAHVGKDAEREDAVLAVTVLSETLETKPARNGSRMFHIEDSAKLTRPDGTIVWQEMEARNSIPYNVDEPNGADAWKTPGLVDGVDRELSEKLVFRMFYMR